LLLKAFNSVVVCAKAELQLIGIKPAIIAISTTVKALPVVKVRDENIVFIPLLFL
jgi:hypothetical protein